jgi:hypothetical protein
MLWVTSTNVKKTVRRRNRQTAIIFRASTLSTLMFGRLMKKVIILIPLTLSLTLNSGCPIQCQTGLSINTSLLTSQFP